jgi:TonB family protein
MQFIIKSDGSIADVKTLKGVHPLLDAEAKRIVKAMPKWTPGKQKGEAVAVRFILPIAFQTNISTEDVYAAGTVEVNPEFPGGNSKLMEFIKDNLKYPKEVAEQGIQGRVTMQFIIKSDGSIGDVKTLKGVHPLLDAEAARVIKAMPKWTPGKQKGETVAVQFILPIAFQGERSTVNDKR